VSDSQKSFFSGLSGAVTGIAALLSAIVGVVGLSVNQGWIGGSKNASTTGTTAAGGQPGSGSTSTIYGATSSTDAAAAQFNVNPTSIVFQALGPRDATVTVANTGIASFTVVPPTITGQNPDRFSVDDKGCSATVDPGRSCDLKVTFIPKAGTFNAKFVVQVTGAARAVEIPIQATAIL
jgi:hypothetical protein